MLVRTLLAASALALAGGCADSPVSVEATGAAGDVQRRAASAEPVDHVADAVKRVDAVVADVDAESGTVVLEVLIDWTDPSAGMGGETISAQVSRATGIRPGEHVVAELVGEGSGWRMIDAAVLIVD